MAKPKETVPLINSIFGIGIDLTGVHQNFSGESRTHLPLDKVITNRDEYQLMVDRKLAAKRARAQTIAAQKQFLSEFTNALKAKFPATHERPNRNDNPFCKSEKGTVPIAAVKDFLEGQELRTGIKREDAYAQLPVNIRAFCKVTTYRAYFNASATGKNFPAPVAIGLWDVYAEIPGLHEVSTPATPSPK